MTKTTAARKAAVNCARWLPLAWLACFGAALAFPAALQAGLLDGKPAAEKAAPKLPEPLTREAVRELVSRLSDAEVRQLLIQQLDRTAAPGKARTGEVSGVVMAIESQIQRARPRMAELGEAIAGLPETLVSARQKFNEGRAPGHFEWIAAMCLILLALAYLAERAYRYAIRGHRRRLDEPSGEGFAAHSARNALRFLLDLGSLAVFGAAALALFYAGYQGHESSRLLVLTVIAGALVLRLVALASRLLLEPGAPALRLLPLEDHAAQRLHRGVLEIAGLYVFGMLPLFLLVQLGAPQASADAISLVVAALGVASAIATFWAVKNEIGAMIRGEEERGALARIFADLWPALATAYVLVVYAALALDVLAGRHPEGKGMLSVLLLLALPIVVRLLTRVLHAALSARAEDTAERARSLASSFEPVLRKAIHIVVAVLGMLLLADLWQVDLMTMAERGVGKRIAGEFFAIAIILLVGYLLWEFSRAAVANLIEREGGLPATKTDDEGADVVATRLGTLLPLIRATLQLTILVVATLSVLSALGINVLPLLAGAGIVGVAIGFGSQTLVRDIVSGAFFLADDAFRMGEYVETGELKGTVERVSIRSLFLRHHRGAINILPYGEIKWLRNLSRDWVIDKLVIGITYDSDIEKARKLVKKVGQQLAANPEYAPKILEPLKMQGVEAFGDFAIQIRMKMKTKPNEQFVIRRKAYAMIKKTFDENGIKFAFPTVQVSGGGESGSATAAAAVAAQLLAEK